jgi:hypothetical protein
MVDILKLQTIDRFYGINNVDPDTRLVPVVINREYVYPLQQASNVDIDNTFGVASRSGYDDVLSGASIHSLWADGPICLFVDGALNQLNDDYSIVTLRSGLTPGARMSYAQFNDKTYYTNRNEIGYVKDGASNLLVDPVLEFKLPLPPGQLVEYYRGCLYVARDNILYISDPLCDYFDTRTGYKQFAGKITLLRAVDTGLYVGDEKIWWVKGDSAEEFERLEAYSYRAIPYTDVRTNGQNIGDGMKGNIAIWTGENGICMGDNSGQVSNLTEGRYNFPAYGIGAGFIREKQNVRHYINSLY